MTGSWTPACAPAAAQNVGGCRNGPGTSKTLAPGLRIGILQGQDYAGAPGCPHPWLRLPPPWRTQEFTDTAGIDGVGVLPAEAFMISRSQAPHAVRINLGAATSTENLKKDSTA